MRITIDRVACAGAGTCAATAPDVFAVDDDFVVTLIDDDPDESLRDDVEEAVLYCPHQALSLDSD